MFRDLAVIGLLCAVSFAPLDVARGQPPRYSVLLPQAQPANAGIKSYAADDSQLMTQAFLLNGLDPNLAAEVRRRAASSSLGDSVGWKFDAVAKSIGMSEAEVIAGNRLMQNRLTQRNEAIQACYSSLVVGPKEASEKEVRAATETLLKSEAKSEADLNSSLEEVLRPSCVDELVRYLIRKNRVTFVNVLLVADALKLDQRQVAAFNRANEFLQKTLLDRLQAGKSKPGDLTEEPGIEKRILEAENSLTLEQFEVVAQSVGIIPPEATLEAHFREADSQVRRALAKRYSAFKAIEKKLSELDL